MKKKQQFKGEVISRTVVKNNILKIYRLSDMSDKYDWYGEAHMFARQLAEEYDVNINTACGVIAALSPVKTWKQNKECAKSLFATGNGKHMKLFNDKAMRIFECDGDEWCVKSVLKGKKIISFFENILHPDKVDKVTIDRHALSVALGKWITDEDYRGITKTQYKFFEDCYKYTAERIGISPTLLQSTTWERFRKIKKDYR